MDWFAKHPQWLYWESCQLSNDSNYNERYQFAEYTLISTGDILVRKTKIEYHPILIVYPEATPYIIPKMYLIKDSLSEKVALQYSCLSPEKIHDDIIRNVRVYNRRHQNNDGSICFLETGDFHDDYAEFYSIKDVIKRLRKWLSGEIPKDSQEVELYFHFKNRYSRIKYLLPDIFLDKEIVKGQFFASLPPLLLTSFIEDKNTQKTFMGRLIMGKNIHNIEIPPKIYKNDNLTLFAYMPDPLELLENPRKERISKLLSDEKIIEGYWWDIMEEPEPFDDMETLARYIGNESMENGFIELINYLEVPLKKYSDNIYLGLRFPARKTGKSFVREKEWQMFRIERGKRTPIIETDCNRLRQELIERLKDYKIYAINQEYFTEDYFHMRNAGRASRVILKEKKLSLIGCGAIGSEIADCLSKAGIGSLLLVDKEQFHAHNSIRHCLGINKTGFSKVHAMAEYLTMHNPFVITNSGIMNIIEAQFDKYLPKEYIGISSVADDNVESYLNEICVEENRMLFYVRALRGGKVGRMFRVIPTKDACKYCLALYKKQNNPIFPNIPEDKNLPVITNECNNPIRPASAADLKIIASIAARIIIDYFQGKDENNHWIWTTESIDNLKINSHAGLLHSKFIPPHPDCPVCAKSEEKQVFICKKAYELMKEESKTSDSIETGGILIGCIKNNRYLILKATGPGPNAVRTNSLFIKDKKYCQTELENAIKEFGINGMYLGEWHYHSQGSFSPSGKDIRSLTEIAQQDNYRINKPISIIFSPKIECAITIHDKKGICIQSPFRIIENEDISLEEKTVISGMKNKLLKFLFRFKKGGS